MTRPVRRQRLSPPAHTDTYTFTVEFIDGGPNGADNIFKSARVEADFDWEAVNN